MPRFHREPLGPDVHAHGVEPRRTRAERNQRIHRRGAVFQALPGAGIEMTAREDHHAQGNKTNDQPQRAVVVGDHHVVAEHPPHHHRNTHQQGDNRLPAEALHGSNCRFLLALAAFGIIFDGLRAVARFFNGLY